MESQEASLSDIVWAVMFALSFFSLFIMLGIALGGGFG